MTLLVRDAAADPALTGENNPAPASNGDESPSRSAYIVLWRTAPGASGTEVYGQRYDASGTKIGAAFQVNTHTANNQIDPKVKELSDGGFVMVWESYGQDGSHWGVYGQRYDAAGARVGEEFRVNTHTEDSQGESSLAALADGGFVVTWISLGQGDDPGGGVYGQRYDAAGARVGEEFHINTRTEDSQLGSSVTALSDGGFVVVWLSYGPAGRASGVSVYGQRYDAAGAKAGGEFLVNAHTAHQQWMPSVASLADGGFVVVWQYAYAHGGGTPSAIGVYGQRYDATGAAVGNEFRISSEASYAESYPEVAALSGGGFVVVWHSSNGADASGKGVYGQRYDAAGNKVGSEFLVNANTEGSQSYPAVTALSDGGFAVAWHSATGSGGSGAGMYGQRYDAAGNKVGGEVALATVGVQSSGGPAIAGFVLPGITAAIEASDATAGEPGDAGAFTVTLSEAAPPGGVTLRYTVSGTAESGSDYVALSGEVTIAAGERSATISLAVLDDRLAEMAETVTVTLTEATGANGGRVTLGATSSATATIADNDGTAAYVVVWHSYGQDGSQWGVYGQRYDAAGAKVGVEFQVNTYTTNDQWDPTVTVLADGGFVVMWHSYGQDGSGKGVYGQRYDAAGVAVGGEFQVNTHTTNDQWDPTVTALTDGGFVVVWHSLDYGYSGRLTADVYGQRYDASGVAVGVEFRVNTYAAGYGVYRGDEGYEGHATVTALSDGGFVVVWEDDGFFHYFSDEDWEGRDDGDHPLWARWDDYGFTGLYGQRYDAAGVAVGGEFRLNAETRAAQPATVTVTALPDGGFVAVWQSPGGQYRDGRDSGFSAGYFIDVYGQRYDAAGVAVGGEFQVNTCEWALRIEGTSVTALTDGGFVVAWGSQTRTYDSSSQNYNWIANVYGQRYDASGVAVGGEFLVNTYAGYKHIPTTLTALSDGGFVVAWRSSGQDGSGSDVYGQRYDASGVAVGGEFLVNTYTEGLQGGPSIAALVAPGGTETIADDDITATLEASDATAGEPGDAGAFTVTLSGAAPPGGVTLRYTVSGTAESGSDYTALSGEVTIAAGARSATISLAVLDDRLVESAETVTLTLTGATGANGGRVTLGAASSATVTIADNDITATLEASDATAGEPGDAGAFTVTLSEAAPPGGVTLRYTVSGTAESGSDYTALSGEVTIAAGARSATISLAVLDDRLVESAETVTLALTGAIGANGGRVTLDPASSATVTIADNDITATLEASDATAGEPGDAGAFTVMLSEAAPPGGVTLRYTVSGTAESGSDYTALSGEVTIAAGERSTTISLAVLDDRLVESAETVTVTLTGATGANGGRVTLDPASTSATVTIADNDITAALEASDAAAGEPGDAGAFTVTLSEAAPPGGVTLRYTVSGTAESGSDYVALSGEVTIAAGERSAPISLAVLDDSFAESAETVTLTLTEATGANGGRVTLGAASSATVTIADNDITATLEASDAAAGEPGDAGAFTVTLSEAAPAGGVTLRYTVSGTAESGSDYTALSGEVTIAAGARSAPISLAVLDDRLAESAETVTVTLTEATGANGGRVTLGAASSATVTIADDDGPAAYVVVWHSDGQDGSGRGVYGQRYDAAGAKVGVEFRVNTHTEGAQEFASVTMMTDGGFLVVWQSYNQDGSCYGVYGQRYDADGARAGNEFQIHTHTTDEQSAPSVTALTGGAFVAVWESHTLDGARDGVYGQCYDAAGNRLGGEFRIHTGTAGAQEAASVTALADGGFLVVWHATGQDGSGTGIYGQRYDAAGARAGSEFQAHTYTAGAQENPSATALPSGTYVVVWESRSEDGSHDGVYGQCYAASGARLGGEFRINANGAPGLQKDASVTTLSDGGFLVVWQSYDSEDGSSTGVYGQRYSALGARVGGEFQVNGAGTAFQRSPAVTALSDGGFLVVWDGYGRDGSSIGMYGQRYDATGAKVGAEYALPVQGVGAGNPVIAALQTPPGTVTLEASDATAGESGDTGAFTVTLSEAAPAGGVTLRYTVSGTAESGSDYIALSGVVTIAAGERSATILVTVNDDSLVESAETVTIELRDAANPNFVLGPAARATVTITDDDMPSEPGAPAYLLVWRSYPYYEGGFTDGTYGDVYGQRYDIDGNPLGEQFRVNTYARVYQEDPSAAVLSGGGFVVVWASYGQDGSRYGVYGQRYDAAGAQVGEEFLVNTYTISNQLGPQVTALSDGGFVVVWESYNQDGSGDDIYGRGSGYGIYGQRYDADGAKVGGEFQVNTYTTYNQYSAQVTALSNGAFVVVWTSYFQDGSYTGVYGQCYDANGARVGGESRINTHTANDQLDPVIAPLSDGGFVIAWISENQDGDDDGVYAQRYDAAGAQVGAEFQVNTHTSGRQSNPAVAALLDGGFLLAWHSRGQDASSYGVYAQRYDADGARVGGEFQVNTYIRFSQSDPSVTALSDGGFLIAWHSYQGQDGSGRGVYAQRYDADGNKVGTEFALATQQVSTGIGPAFHSVIALDLPGSITPPITATLEASDATAGESGDAGAFTVTLSEAAPEGGVTLRYTVSGTAESGSDYVELSGEVTIAAGERSATISLAVLDDRLLELAETVTLTLTEATGANGGRVTLDPAASSATVTIADNDITAALEASDATAGESGDAGAFTVTLSEAAPEGGVTLRYTVSGTAESGSDYVALSGEVTIAAGERSATISLAALDDSFAESAETVTVTLTEATGANGRRVTLGSAPSATVTITDDDGPAAYVVVWHSDGQDGSGYGVYGQHYDAGGNKVGGEFRVNTYTEGDQGRLTSWGPTVTTLSDGGFVVVWESEGQDGSGYGVYGQRYDADGNKVGGEFRVNTNREGNQWYPTVTALSDGGFVVVWQSGGQDGSGYGVYDPRYDATGVAYGQRYDATGVAVGGEFQVNPDALIMRRYSSETVLSDGGSVVVWTAINQDGGFDTDVYGQRYDADGNKVGGEFRVNTYTTDYQWEPTVTALPDGGFVVAWTSTPSINDQGYSTGVYGQHYDADGNKVGGEFRVNTYTEGWQSAPAIAALATPDDLPTAAYMMALPALHSLIALGLPGSAAPPLRDSAEGTSGNDMPEDATELGALGNLQSLATMSGLTMTAGDLSRMQAGGEAPAGGDWFHFTAQTGAQQPNLISIGGVGPDDGNLDLYIYDEDMNLLGQSRTDRGAESVSIPAAGRGFYIQVVGRDGGSLNAGYDLDVAHRTFDLDGDGGYDALTDGLMALAHLFEHSPEQVLDFGASGAGARGGDSLDAYLGGNAGLGLLDIDGNGRADALTDGLILLAKMFDYPTESLAAFAASDATRDAEAIEAFLETHMPDLFA